MTELHDVVDHSHDHDHPDDDADINFRPIVWSIAILVLTTIVAAIAMWPLVMGTKSVLDSGDPALPSLVADGVTRLPPGPKLQPSPPVDMEAMRERDRLLTDTWGWVDEGAGVARVPVDHVIDAFVESGIPVVTNEDAANYTAQAAAAAAEASAAEEAAAAAVSTEEPASDAP